MSCVLRVSGPGAVAAVAKTNLGPYRSEDGAVHILVSDADFHELDLQISEATTFLRDHFADLQILASQPDAAAALDFGISRRDAPAQFDLFPRGLVELAGKAGLGLEISQYPVSGPEA
jgi:hypothetical protein